jgi:hypothetical protein
MIKNGALILISCAFAALRVLGFKSQAFQAFSHLFVGGLFGAFAIQTRPIYLVLGLAMSGVELIVASYQKFTGTVAVIGITIGLAMIIGAAIYAERA